MMTSQCQGMGWGMWIIPLFIVLIVFFVFKNFSIYKSESAFDILKKRYAKGEITKEEFERMKEDLQV